MLLKHPVVGYGFSPLSYATARTTTGYTLPHPHADWLSLGFHAGAIALLASLWAVWTLLRHPGRTKWAAACRSSLLGLVAVGWFTTCLSHPRIGSVALLLLLWLIREQNEALPSC